MFISTVRKYTRADKLTSCMLNDLIEHIEVHQAEKVDGIHVQKLTIHYNCVGTIEIPGVLPLPEPDILIQTRKRAALSCSQSQKSVCKERPIFENGTNILNSYKDTRSGAGDGTRTRDFHLGKVTLYH